MKIAFVEMEDWSIKHVQNNLKGHNILFFKELLKDIDPSKLKDVEVLSTFVFSKIDKKTIDKLPKLKMIATMSTGFDHIDLKECAKRKIIVCNVPHYGENTVAEHTFALILTLSRKIYPSIRKTKKGLFNQDNLRGFDLKGKTIGLVGTGHISYHVAKIAKGFEMNIIGYDIFKNKEFEKLGLKYMSLNDLLKKSDIVTLHLPLNDKTRHTINNKNISLMKKNALIINTARGGLIDTMALGKAIVEGKIAGAGLDVLENEQYIKHEDELLKAHFKKTYDMRTVLENQILTKLDNVAITPHNAFNSEEALKRIIDTTIDNIKKFSKGQPENVVK
ncbi:MAG: NAD(P)-dependent oxidoreductase [Candidatus Woesearchaeota archaeon]